MVIHTEMAQASRRLPIPLVTGLPLPLRYRIDNDGSAHAST